MVQASEVRLLLTELPQVAGASTRWKQEIDAKLRAFKARFGWLVDPLLVPVALEVVIKPPPSVGGPTSRLSTLTSQASP